jgi:hypothetical protein
MRSNGAVIRLATGDKLTVEVTNVLQAYPFGSDTSVKSFTILLLIPDGLGGVNCVSNVIAVWSTPKILRTIHLQRSDLVML